MNALKTYYRIKREEAEKEAQEQWNNMAEEEKQAAHEKAKELLETMAIVNSMTGGAYSK